MRPRKGTHALLVSLALGALTLGIALPERAQAQGPTQTITVSFKDKEVASILDFIATRTGYKITYDPEVRTGGYKTTVSFDEVSPDKAVEGILKGTPFIYEIDGHTIRIFRPQQQTSAKAQITGVVRDQDGLPITGANVRIQGTKLGAQTGTQGHFTINTDRASGNLHITCIGYTGVILPFTQGTPVTVTLKEDVKSLGSVTVIAYGKRNTRELRDQSPPSRQTNSRTAQLPLSKASYRDSSPAYRSPHSQVPQGVEVMPSPSEGSVRSILRESMTGVLSSSSTVSPSPRYPQMQLVGSMP